MPTVITSAIRKKNVIRRIYYRILAPPVTFVWLFDRVLGALHAVDARS
jgi:hypothetical protein